MSSNKFRKPISRRQSPTATKPAGFDPDALQQKIIDCRGRLAIDPGDLPARIALAWSLLFVSLCYGRDQELWSQIVEQTEKVDGELSAVLKKIRAGEARGHPDYRRLLKESLIQASTVCQLTLDARERDEAARIRTMAEDLGFSEVVAESDMDAQRMLMRVARAICSEKREKTRLAAHRRNESEEDDFEDF